MKQVAVEFTGYPSRVAAAINQYLILNPGNRIVTTSSVPINGQISLIAIVEGKDAVKSVSVLRDEPFFTTPPFPQKTT